jgi:hypothetical protein
VHAQPLIKKTKRTGRAIAAYGRLRTANSVRRFPHGHQIGRSQRGEGNGKRQIEAGQM